jgi:anaerobic ribonucleoside-triphosphate reductase activating protein
MRLHIAGVNYESFADADGVSCVIFFSGCHHHCNDCHSKITHDFNYGQLVTTELINEINMEIDKRPFLNCLVLSGGDPMYSANEIYNLLSELHIPNNKLWCFSGFTYEEIRARSDMNKLLRECDVLVDGKFESNKRDITLRFRGSSNQRLIDVQKSLEKKEVMLWEN